MKTMSVRLSTRNTARLIRAADILQSDPEKLVNECFLDELRDFFKPTLSMARCCAQRMRYKDQQTALDVAMKLNGFFWQAGFREEPLCVASDEAGRWYLYERDNPEGEYT